MPNYSAIIFDVDGLIVDSEELYSKTYIKTLADHGKTIAREDYTAAVGIPVEVNAARAVKHFRLNTTPDAYCEAWMDRFEEAISTTGGIDLMPGIIELLDHVNGRYLLGIASSTKRPRMMTTLTNGLLPHLRALPERNRRSESLDDMFSAILSGSDVVHTKPAPDIYLLAAEQLGVDPIECVVFEDSQAGVIAAKSAGMTVFAVPNFFTSHQDHSQADKILYSLTEAIELL
ncbi:MAG: HAD family phosphatase [Candidatus Latescibacterota bacterium]|nr:HAD family phosphatase [Candidatus Latescibacterota bacterium]